MTLEQGGRWRTSSSSPIGAPTLSRRSLDLTPDHRNRVRALAMLARHEAVLLDAVFTRKAMAEMIDLIRKSYFEGSVFVHTSGAPAIFAYERALEGPQVSAKRAQQGDYS